ncbi:MAG: ParB N-terminal domain-containing protein [Armatimonadetes bacterium]|nr:ParB N-terminal domain-containing protein [Armatimonadota bacterium]
MSKPLTAYSIDYDGLSLDIALAETSRLLIHEEIIPEKLEELKNRIEREEVQSAPIIVDRNTFVVLDGMHRTAIMKELCCRFTCVCLLDYLNPKITIERWCRIIPHPFTELEAENLLKEMGLSYETIDADESPDDESLILCFKNKAYRMTNSDDIVDIFKKSYEIETRLQASGYDVRHCTEVEARTEMKKGSIATAIYPPKVKKHIVVELAQGGKLLTPKATRHRLPARPVGVNVPLSLLRDKKITLQEANKRLRDLLQSKKVKRLKPGAHWMGRTYDEVLYVFSDPQVPV